MRIVTLALTFGLGLAVAPVSAQAPDKPLDGSHSFSPAPEVIPAPAQQPPPQEEVQERVPPAPPRQAPTPRQAPSVAPTESSNQAQAVPPAAAEAPAPAPSRRYSFNRVDDGFVRFDNTTGQVAYCSPRTVGWSCQAVSEDRAALDQEIARLKQEIEALKKEIAELRAPPAPPPPSPPAAVPPPATVPPKADDGEITLKLPTQQDIARAREYLTDTWHRLIDMLDQFQRDLREGGRGGSDESSSI